MARLDRSSPRRPRTIQDVAALAGVSMATVSRVLNGHPDVSPATREAVLRVVREHGFSKNRTARGLSAGRTSLIGVTVPVVDTHYASVILAGAAEALYDQDMRLVLCPTQHEHDREVLLLDRLMHGTTDGALLILPFESNDELRTLLNHGFPFVIVDALQPVPEGMAGVSSNHSAGAVLATEHLLSLGHRRIGAITGPVGWLPTEERRRGFRAALAAAGIAPDRELEVATDFNIEPGVEAAARLLDLPDPPTAIFGFNDHVAIGALLAARARGVRVPEELSVVGFDDVLEARITGPPLTTVRQPLAEMGRMAVSLLTRLLDHQRVEALRVELHTRLVIRESTGPV